MSQMLLYLLRDQKRSHQTIGSLSVDGQYFCNTLEDTVREVKGQPVSQWKIKGQTAIPAGRYRVTIDQSAHFGRRMLHLLDVPGFSGIRIHGGNTEADVEGCIAVGKIRTATGIGVCADVLATLEGRVGAALAAGRDVFIEVV